MTLPLAYYSILALYAFFLAVGWYAARGHSSSRASDFIIAGRNMPLWLATLTMTATWVDGGYLLGTAEGAYKTGLASGAQGGLAFGLSLILGGLFFAGIMRRHEFTTLIDPFEARFGRTWAAVLFVPAMLGEVFWSAELLVALGTTSRAVLGVELTTAIVVCAVVVTLYTALGGMWSVAYTDVVQLGLVAAGMLAAIPPVLAASGGWTEAFAHYTSSPRETHWSAPMVANWWDVTAMLVFGGIPWNCYFQRVLACQSPAKARAHSLWAGVLTMAFTIPPLILGIAAFNYPWTAPAAAELASHPSGALPLLLRYAAPAAISILGLGAIIAAVTSSYSASILSAGSMFAWNCVHRLAAPNLSTPAMKRLVRISILALSAGAVLMALHVESVQALWFFTSDLIFVLLFPQLVAALYDVRANRIGSIAAFVVSLILRLGGGEPLFGLRPFIFYPEHFTSHPADWYDASGAMLFPHKTLAAAVGMIVLPMVSRLTASLDPPRRLRNPGGEL